MKPEKPITTNMMKKANAIFMYMIKAYPRYCTKDELARVIGDKSRDKRAVRDVIALLSTRKPIISNSTTSGYKVGLLPEDDEEMRHTWAELSSRIEELEKRIKPLIAKLEEHNRGVCVNG